MAAATQSDPLHGYLATTKSNFADQTAKRSAEAFDLSLGETAVKGPT